MRNLKEKKLNNCLLLKKLHAFGNFTPLLTSVIQTCIYTQTHALA